MTKTLAELSNNEKEQYLRDFVLDIECLNDLDKWGNEVNYFEISGMSNAEIRHSNVLAWLFDANQNHGLGDIVIKRFIQKVLQTNCCTNIDVFKLGLLDYSSFLIKREWQNIDILLLSEDTKTVIVIENKIDSTENQNQTRKYRKKIDDIYPDYTKLYIYLTKFGEEAQDKEHWLFANYSQIVEILQNILNTLPNIDTNVKLIVNNYIDILRRKVLMDNKELQDLCEKIYNNHKVALDLIFEYRPDLMSNISDYISDFLNNNQEELGIVYNKNNSCKSYIRFTTNYIEKILPPCENKSFGWGNGYRIMYEIECLNNAIVVFATISNLHDPLCLKIYNLTQQHSTSFHITKKNTMPKNWCRIFRCSQQQLNTDDYDNDFSVIKENLDKRLRLAIKEIKEDFESVLIKELK